MKRVIKSAYYYDDDEYERVDRTDDPQEIAIAAIAYNYGISREDAIEEYKTITEDKLKDFISYYFRRDIPQKMKDEYKKSTDDAAQDVCNAIFNEHAEGYDVIENFCNLFDVEYPDSVVDLEDSHVCRWDDNTRAVSYFGYDELQKMIEEAEENGIKCGIAGNGDLYIYD